MPTNFTDGDDRVAKRLSCGKVLTREMDSLIARCDERLHP
jgi:hypothetical protein